MKVINADEFEAAVLRSPSVVLVDFYGDHCPVCRLLTPILEEVAADLEGQVEILKMRVEQNMNLANRLGVVALPTVMIFKDGEERVRMVGLQNKARLLEAIEMAKGDRT